jgi:hypothetical protein
MTDTASSAFTLTKIAATANWVTSTPLLCAGSRRARDKRLISRLKALAGRYSTAKPRIGLPAAACVTLPAMFVVSEEAAAAIRAIFEKEGELSAAIEVRRLFAGVTDNAKARECARTIAGWKPLSAAACQITRLRPPPGRGRSTKTVITS